MRHRVSMSKFLLFALLVLGLCVASLPPLTMAEPPTPTPLPPRPRYDGLESIAFLPSPVRPTKPSGITTFLQPVSWSKLVFQFFESYVDNNWEIYLANGDGSNKTRLTDHIAVDIYPRLNRGCTRIVFASNRTGNYEIFTMNPDGSGLSQLTFHNANDYSPFWSPDGTKIAFSSYRDGQSEIYVMNADGSGQTRLTWDSAYDGGPAWSPDGTKIAFASWRSGGYCIWAMNADGSGQTQLSTQPYSENPAWSPDGSQITYDCDGNNDGWQELWLMNADGSNQHQVYDPGEDTTDAWVRSWAPDGRYVAFTRISWVYYQGNWYWTTAYLEAWDSLNPWSTIRLSNQGMDWYPDWQTTDAWAPTSSVNALPAQSLGPFTVRWSGADTGPSGLKNYDVQIKDGAGGAWADWQMGTPDTSASYAGVGGHTYYFRSRARDNAYNVEPWPPDYDTFTTVEALPPTTAVQPLPAYSHNDLAVSWGGSDPGGSGIKTYDVQYRDTVGGNWTDWQMGTTITSTSFSGIPGHAYYFRSRAVDNAQNVESWPLGDGDTSTTLYTWAVTGTVRDNRDTVVVGTVVTTTPSAFYSAPSGANGAYAAYVADASATYTATWAKPGYGTLPPTSFPAAEDAHADAVLPPADNLVRNWGFESGSLGSGDWLASGVITPVVTGNLKHTGQYAVLLGQRPLDVFNVSSNNSNWESSLYMVVDRSGVIHVTWAGYTSAGYGNIYYTRRGNDGVWSSPQNISRNSGEFSYVYYPCLAVDVSGVVHAAWLNYTFGQSGFYYTRRVVDGTWDNPQNISGPLNVVGSAGPPQLAVDKSGTVHMVWPKFITAGDIDLYYAQRGSDGVWSSPQNISNIFESWGPQLAVEGNGVVHVAWSELLPGDHKAIYYSRRGNDGIWSSPQDISGGVGWLDPLQLALDGNGVIHVVWKCGVDLYYARRESNGVWSTPQRISGDVSWSGGFRFVVDEGGGIHVVWEAIVKDIYYVRRGNDGTWSSIQNISHNSGSSEKAQVVVNESGIVYVVWTDDTPGQPDIYYAWRGNDGLWSSPQNISANSGSSSFPEMVIDRDGVIHIAWQDSTSGPDDVYYVRASFVGQVEDSSVSQIVTIPITMSNPTLSFLHQFIEASAASWFNVQVDNGITATTIFSTALNSDAWTHHWFNLSPWASHTIALTFNVHHAANDFSPRTYLDEITLGSAYPDLWVSKSGGMAALPGEQVAYTIAYGNRGGVAASGVRITDTLSTGLSFVDANPPPVTTSTPLVWEVGDLLAQSGLSTIVVTATVASVVTLGSTLTNTVAIGAIAPEIETINNTTQAATFIGYRIYLPIFLKTYLQW